MKFNFKLICSPADKEKLVDILQQYKNEIQITDSYLRDDLMITHCVSHGIATGLRISEKIGAEIEIMGCS